MRIYLFIALSAFCARISAAEAVFGLSEALERVKTGNPVLLSAQKELDRSRGLATAASAAPNPELSGSVTEIPFHRESGDVVLRDLWLNQVVELPGKRGLRKQAAMAEAEAAEAAYELLQADILRRAKELYWTLALDWERLSFASENLNHQLQFSARVQERYSAGKARLSELAGSRLEQARAENFLLQARSRLEMTQSSLNSLMGRPLDSELDRPAPLEEKVLELDETALVSAALLSRPDLKALAVMRRGAQAELSLAKRLLWAPDLKAGVAVQNLEGSNRGGFGFSLGMALPLWYSYSGERRAAAGRNAALELQERQLGMEIALEVRRAFSELRLSAGQIRLWKRALGQAAEAARLTEQQYLEGRGDLLAMTLSRRDLADATLSYLGALGDYQINLAGLERASGVSLSEGGKI